mmetsp:Transcript_7207/g.6314  ORF Transcript_7207/g.6314 Transcript_7207/m.6314 type:complete len:115 (-) Transcript_7207:1153-1497(-)
MVKANSVHKIIKVQANYLNFQSLAPNYFTLLNGKSNFKAIYQMKDLEMVSDHISQGLFSLFQSLGGMVPYIKGAPTELVDKVIKKMQMLHGVASSTDQQKKSKERPLLIVLDRN